MRIDIYDEAQKEIWDNFVKESKNGTFLILRNYMDYHKDRFNDSSLLIWDEKDTLVALFPANSHGDAVVSHAGLTYGGFITDGSMKTSKMLRVFDNTLTKLKQSGINQIIYKTIPYIYHKLPAEEDRYALFLCNACLLRRSVLTVISRYHRLPFQERRIRGVKKARKNGLIISHSDDYSSYWQILTDLLWKNYNTKPVHTLAEIELLRSYFPNNIKLFACSQYGKMLAGVVIYETMFVAHVQYVAANDPGRELGALDFLFNELVNVYYKDKAFFDFGTSDENNGRYLNRGLIDQKEGFGARAVVQDQYEIQLADWHSGSLVKGII